MATTLVVVAGPESVHQEELLTQFCLFQLICLLSKNEVDDT